MKIIGITGSSGTGKSTVSSIFNEKEYIEVIDADKVARELNTPNTEYSKAIKGVFGKEVFFEDGSLNRKALADKIYDNENAKKSLDSLNFKYVFDEILSRIENIDKEKIKITIIDAPLLFESGLDKKCDYIIAVIAPEEVKIDRICKRDKIDVNTAKKRLDSQQNDEYYTEKSDFVIQIKDILERLIKENKNKCNFIELEGK